MSTEIILFYILLFVIAFLYSTVGHGGASGYLALMTFFSVTPIYMRSTALLLNIVVSLIAFLSYSRNKHFKWSLFWPFAISSIPAAFFGGMISVESGLYKKILAVFLLISVLRLLGVEFRSQKQIKKLHLVSALMVGAIIGFLSSLIGIGGGIILSPVILLLHWADMKQTAALSALFIFVNSLAGLAGVISRGFEFSTEILPMILLALIGGALGSYLGAKKFNISLLNFFLATVLILASIKLVIT